MDLDQGTAATSAPRRHDHAVGSARPPDPRHDHAGDLRAVTPWGMLAAVDLHAGDLDRLADPDRIRAVVAALVRAVGMRAFGPLMMERFGQGDLEGWSAMQFIETSTITVHADEVGGRCFVDIFSCRSFDPGPAAAVVVEHFGGTAHVRVLHR